MASLKQTSNTLRQNEILSAFALFFVRQISACLPVGAAQADVMLNTPTLKLG
jgi:hypothetical protein